MRSLGNVGLGLSVVFFSLLLALVAEIYYLLWWKRRITRREIIEDDYTNATRKTSNILCCTNQASSAVNISTSTQIHQEIQFHPSQSKSFDDHQNGGNFLEAELITGLPRFLFTIKEETIEEMELSEEGKLTGERKRNSLNDLMNNMDNITPYATPLSSPPFMTPCSTPMEFYHSNNHSGSLGGYNPFYESSNGAEFNKIIKYSPPPKFKFLRNAEEKLLKKTMLLEQLKRDKDLSKDHHQGVNGSFITIIIANSKENDMINHHYHSPLCHYSSCPSSSSNSQLLPLAK